MEPATRDHVFEVDADGFDPRRILVPLFCCFLILFGGLMVCMAVLMHGQDPRSAWLPVLVLGSVYLLLMRWVRALDRSGRWPAARSQMLTALSASAPIWIVTSGSVMRPYMWPGLALITTAIFILSLPRVESAQSTERSTQAR